MNKSVVIGHDARRGWNCRDVPPGAGAAHEAGCAGDRYRHVRHRRNLLCRRQSALWRGHHDYRSSHNPADLENGTSWCRRGHTHQWRFRAVCLRDRVAAILAQGRPETDKPAPPLAGIIQGRLRGLAAGIQRCHTSSLTCRAQASQNLTDAGNGCAGLINPRPYTPPAFLNLCAARCSPTEHPPMVCPTPCCQSVAQLRHCGAPVSGADTQALPGTAILTLLFMAQETGNFIEGTIA